jgi:hypothetical protein
MEKCDFTSMTLKDLKKLNFMRWGRQPIPNLWLMPGPLILQAKENQTLYGIDGQPYVIGFHSFDPTLLFGYLAYGVKIESDVEPGGPELPPEKLSQLSQGRWHRMSLKMAKNRGMFIPE